MKVSETYDSMLLYLSYIATETSRIPSSQRLCILDQLIAEKRTDPFVLSILTSLLFDPDQFNRKKTRRKNPVIRLVDYKACSAAARGNKTMGV